MSSIRTSGVAMATEIMTGTVAREHATDDAKARATLTTAALALCLTETWPEDTTQLAHTQIEVPKMPQMQTAFLAVPERTESTPSAPLPLDQVRAMCAKVVLLGGTGADLPAHHQMHPMPIVPGTMPPHPHTLPSPTRADIAAKNHLPLLETISMTGNVPDRNNTSSLHRVILVSNHRPTSSGHAQIANMSPDATSLRHRSVGQIAPSMWMMRPTPPTLV